MTMYPEVVFALIAFTVLGLVGLYCLLMWVWVRVHDDYSWWYNGKKYTIYRIPDPKDSPYYKMHVPRDSTCEAYYSTIDDPAMWLWAGQLRQIIKNMNDRQKATCILRFVQQNVVYTKDSSQFKKSEYWQFPVNTLMRRKGDCEDSSFLYVCLCYMCDIPVINVDMVGHITCAVDVPSIGKNYELDGVKYYRAETTSPFLNWIGIVLSSDTKIENLVAPCPPPDSFKARMRTEP